LEDLAGGVKGGFSNTFSDEDDGGKSTRFGSPDYYSDWIVSKYRATEGGALAMFKWLFLLAGPVSIGTFALFISSSTSTLIAFAAFVIAIQFIVFSIWMLGWILDKDIGPRAM